jgi:hypothetical protein
MMPKLTHHAPPDWSYDPARTYPQERNWCKPKGLWLSVDGDWERWCRSDWTWHENQVNVEFDLIDPDAVLILDCVDDIDYFDEHYVTRNMTGNGSLSRYRINWEPLTTKWAGIMIAPYQWQRRLDGAASEWYYGWDVASACIWNLDVLKEKK